MGNQLLYPKNTKTRQMVDLSGMWKFAFDFESKGDELNYKNSIPGDTYIPVPSSFADYFTEKEYKEYTGDFWYETTFYADDSWKNKNVDLRFFAAAHQATVYLNGVKLGYHHGGFLPFSFSINDVIKYDDVNTIVVKLNNELSTTTLPCGETKILSNGRKLTKPYFDFFNYSGLIRPVKIVLTPKTSILDITLNHRLKDNKSFTDFSVDIQGDATGLLKVYDKEGKLVSQVKGLKGCVEIENPHLWQPLKSYLYNFVFSLEHDGKIVDEYPLEVGIRTVSIEGNSFLINNKPVYFKGFGKHEDSPVNGRGFNLAYIKRDFELMKWIGANSFRTSHYPYSEEIYQLADKEGFLIIDELPAVGMLVSTRNAVDAADANAKLVPFFDKKEVLNETIYNHLNTLKECVKRDKNYASVIAWSLLNEPDTVGSDNAVNYFEKLFNSCKELDPQKRPRSFASIIASQPGRCKCMHLCDFYMLNRYYGWYVMGGYEMCDAIERLDSELDKWDQTNKPVMFTEYGCDTMHGITRLPSVMWSENYQIEYLKENHKIFDKHKCIIGEQVWNFADFQTTEGIIRADGNKKGIFTRDREPKMAAFYLKQRWESLPIDYKRNKEENL